MAFEKMSTAIDKMWDKEDILGIIKDMNENIRTKCDGSFEGIPNDDWILDPIAQYHICMKIDDMIAYLTTLM